MLCLPPVESAVAGENASLGVIGHGSEDNHLMSLVLEVFGEIREARLRRPHLRRIVLCVNGYAHEVTIPLRGIRGVGTKFPRGSFRLRTGLKALRKVCRVMVQVKR